MSIKSFEAMSKNGNLTAAVMNLDSFPSSYYLTVVNCTSGVLEIPAMSISIPAFGFVQHTFEVQTT